MVRLLDWKFFSHVLLLFFFAVMVVGIAVSESAMLSHIYFFFSIIHTFFRSSICSSVLSFSLFLTGVKEMLV